MLTELGKPISSEMFSISMDQCGLYSECPSLAVGVSGGADSLALTLLADRWAKQKGGKVVALTVDHGLRSESKSEARQVKNWLAEKNISHHILRWQNPLEGRGGIQESAREARLYLMSSKCRKLGILNLLLAHHREDQSETLLARLAAGTGPDGLAGMPKVRLLGNTEGGGVRLLRPLLYTPEKDLAATLTSFKQPWISDPSNVDRRYARARLGSARKILEREGMSASRMSITAARAARDRAAAHIQVSNFLADNALLSRSGFITLYGAPWSSVSDSILVRAFFRIVYCISGNLKPPSLIRLEKLLISLKHECYVNRTLGGCRFVWEKKYNKLLILRESGRIKDIVNISPGENLTWDGRFTVGLGKNYVNSGKFKRLSKDDLSFLRSSMKNTPELEAIEAIPALVRPSLPVFHGLDGSKKIPHLNNNKRIGLWISFNPSFPLCEGEFQY